MPSVVDDLVFDIGAHRGEDTEYYLKRGFRVVSVECEPEHVALLKRRFASEIADGRVTLVDRAIAADPGPVRFYRNRTVSVWGTAEQSCADRNRGLGTEVEEIVVEGMTPQALFRQYGIPFFLKVDIEGRDMLMVKALAEFEARPPYLSIESESASLDSICAEFSQLEALGYDRFKMSPQHLVEQQQVPADSLYGPPVNHVFAAGSSGLFGEDLEGPWLPATQAIAGYRADLVIFDLERALAAGVLRGSLDDFCRAYGHRLGWYDTQARHSSVDGVAALERLSRSIARDRRARLLMERLAGPPFAELAEFCGADDRPGIDETPEWQVWTDQETTLDQQRIEECLGAMIEGTSAIFHVGVGNSSLARRFASQVRIIHGTTVHEEEKTFAESLHIGNYAVSVINKYDRSMNKISEKFDFVVDNNPGSFTCCRFHFCRMMVNYAEMLREPGAILTAEPGLSWVISGANPGWSLTWKDWLRLGEALGIPARQITPDVYALERAPAARIARDFAPPAIADAQRAAPPPRMLLRDGELPDPAEFNRACDAAFADLQLVTPLRPFSASSPTVICVARNEALRLPQFLAHYRSLGIEAFHIVDNASTDETARICAADNRLTLWRTEASYAAAACGQLWVGAVARRYGVGKWVLNVDADEFLVYPGMEDHPLGDLQAWLAGHGDKRLFAPMIDMYGSRRYGRDGLADNRALLAQTPFFDGAARCYQFRTTAEGPLLAGGPRARILSPGNPAKFYLSKFPLACWEADTAYVNPHFPYPFRDNPQTPHGALLHFKFLSDFPQRVSAAVAEKEHWREASEYREYQAWIEGRHWQADLFSPAHSRVYHGPGSLVAAGLVHDIPWPGRAPARQNADVPREDAAADSVSAALWTRYPALKAAETRGEHRVAARRGILRYIPPGSVGAELGVFTGLFSEAILRHASPATLHLVDPWWQAYGEFFPDWGPYTDHGNLATRAARQAAVARAEAARGGCRVDCHVAFSRDWLAAQPDGSLDWVYLDSTHRYEDTIEELRLLRRKVRIGGHILGDDWDPDPAAIHHGVFCAVHEILRTDAAIELVYAGADCQYALRISGPPLPVSPPGGKAERGPRVLVDFLGERAFGGDTKGARCRTAAPPGKEVTVVVTSCGRQDLLENTLDSFFRFNTYPLAAFVVIEDGLRTANSALMCKYAERNVTWLETGVRGGQLRAVDLAYAAVSTPYVFHLEDDWEFYAGGFVEKSLAVLEALPDCLQVWLRALDDTNEHPLAPETKMIGPIPVRKLQLSFRGMWSGFSFNPGLRRIADYNSIGPYGRRVSDIGREPGAAESALSEMYRERGFYAVILADNDGRGYVRHTGDGRRIRPPEAPPAAAGAPAGLPLPSDAVRA